MKSHRSAYVCTAALLLAGGAYGANDGSTADAVAVAKPANTVAFTILPTLEVARNGATYYLVKNGEAWVAQREADLAKDGVERIAVDWFTGAVELAASAPPNPSKLEQDRVRSNGGKTGNMWECYSGTMSSNNRPKYGYSVCASHFTKGVTGAGEAVIGNAVGIFFGTVRRYVAVDQEKLLAAIQQSGLAEMIQEDRLRHHRATFASANIIPKLQTWIRTYKGIYDPEGLVAQAELRLAALLQEQDAQKQQQKLAAYRSNFQRIRTAEEIRTFITKYSDDDPDKLIPEARTKLLAIQEEERKLELVEREHQRKTETRLNAWRKSLKIGDDTFCGPVIEVKPPMLKIAVRNQLPGYASEQWLKASEVYPLTSGCSIVNGTLYPMNEP